MKKKKADKYQKEEEVKKALHDLRMTSKEDDGFKVTEDDFEAIFQKFQGKQTKAYDFITKSDKEYIKSVFRICKKFIDKEEFPDKFGETIFHMIWKKKGPAETLKNNRFVHMKHPMARACEALVFSKCKDDIFEKVTVYQIGGQAGHSPEEHIFTLKSLIGLMYSMGEGLILNLVDIISFFDREDIVDVLEAMEDMGVNQKAIRLWYKLNEKTEIAVKTSVGRSKKTMVGALVRQGSGGAAVGSQAMVDMGMKKYLESSEDEMYYGDVRVESAIYQDDIAKPSHDVRTAQSGMTRLAAMVNERGLEAHRDKTSYLVRGSEPFKKKSEESLMLTPLVFGDFAVKRKISDKYLGQIIHEGGLKESVRATIKERTGKK